MMYQILNVQVRLTRAAIILRSHQLWFDELFVSLLGGPSMAHPASIHGATRSRNKNSPNPLMTS